MLKDLIALIRARPWRQPRPITVQDQELRPMTRCGTWDLHVAKQRAIAEGRTFDWPGGLALGEGMETEIEI